MTTPFFSLALFQYYWKSSKLTLISTSPGPIFAYILAISSRIIIVLGVVPGGDIKVPSSMASATSMSADYPRISNNAHW